MVLAFRGIWNICSDLEIGILLATSYITDAGDVTEQVSETATEDVAFVVRHLQQFSDVIGEAVLCESEVLEHSGVKVLSDFA